MSTAIASERRVERPDQVTTRRDGSGLGLRSPHSWIGLACAFLIGGGALWGERLNLSPSDGLGYGLGIAGLAAMTLLLLYSLRKRLRLLRRAGPMRTWFEAHLVLGLVGPTAILYHSGFELGSTNATVSIACMVAVAGSGVGGRFLYGRMHRSLAGERRTVASFHKAATRELESIAPLLEKVPRASQILDDFAAHALRKPSLLGLPLRVLTTRPRSWTHRRKVLEAIRSSERPHVVPPSVDGAVSRYFSLISRGVELRLFEQLFSLWHAIHVPLTILLFISAGVHVVAVHLY